MSKNALVNLPNKLGKNSGRIFRFSASGTRKTVPDSTREQEAFLVPFEPAKGTGALSQMVKKSKKCWRIIQFSLISRHQITIFKEQKAFLVPFEPAKGTGALSQAAKKSRKSLAHHTNQRN